MTINWGVGWVLETPLTAGAVYQCGRGRIADAALRCEILLTAGVDWDVGPKASTDFGASVGNLMLLRWIGYGTRRACRLTRVGWGGFCGNNLPAGLVRRLRLEDNGTDLRNSRDSWEGVNFTWYYYGVVGGCSSFVDESKTRNKEKL